MARQQNRVLSLSSAAVGVIKAEMASNMLIKVRQTSVGDRNRHSILQLTPVIGMDPLPEVLCLLVMLDATYN